MAIKGDARARKTALRIVGILGVLVAICCVGGIWLGYTLPKDVADRLATLDRQLGADFPEGSVWQLDETSSPGPEATTATVLVVGFVEPPPEAEHAEIVARVWETYCAAFADGGLGIDEIAIGRATGSHGASADEMLVHAGSVEDWQSSRHPVTGVAERTGIPPPPDMAWLHWFDDTTDGPDRKDDER